MALSEHVMTSYDSSARNVIFSRTARDEKTSSIHLEALRNPITLLPNKELRSVYSSTDLDADWPACLRYRNSIGFALVTRDSRFD